jgi:hypothetical protein
VLDVHGFASEEGPTGFNDSLSCARANRAVNVLAGAGVSASQIDHIYKHGATAGDRANQRSVVIVKKARSAPPAAPTGITVNPCPSFPFSLGTRGACGSGTDFTHQDFPSLSVTDTMLVTPFRTRPSSDLLIAMAAELSTLGGTEGTNAATHFAAGGGATRRLAPSSPLGRMANASLTFQTARLNVHREIHRQITAMAAAGTIDCSRINIPSGSLPRISFGFADGTALKAVIGGTQGLEVFALAFTADPATRSYTIRLRFVICDDFGVDASDLYSPGLISFWVLQHERRGFRPYIHELVVESPINGRF